jgi:hypothetical protein
MQLTNLVYLLSRFVVQNSAAQVSPGFFAFMATILILSLWTFEALSSLKFMSLMMKVQTSSQKR